MPSRIDEAGLVIHFCCVSYSDLFREKGQASRPITELYQAYIPYTIKKIEGNPTTAPY